MKKLFAVALLVVGMTTFAQEGKPSNERPQKEQFTKEQRAQLRLKKMVLELDLDANQQEEMAVIIAEQSAKFENFKKERQARKAAGTKPTADEKFAIANKMLDEKIAMKARVKKILNPEQFDKFEKMQDKREKMHNGKRKHGRSKKDLPKE